ncbi:hypothetical protein G7Y89_g7174 [Cudoniella acicularis]|uniref:DUF7730 domain-containing protein n=1 Tax=Cudoniella acicularis TaxID=354080 RepID=A0A8H4W4T6_9HELO|nr:hypothetical protein G7Y89_g7174 [Cudoniella acicularis]
MKQRLLDILLCPYHYFVPPFTVWTQDELIRQNRAEAGVYCERNRPVGLPRKRPRALSLQPEGTRPSFLESPLLRLPYEVRQQIFCEAIGNTVIHLVELPNRLGHIRGKFKHFRPRYEDEDGRSGRDYEGDRTLNQTQLFIYENPPLQTNNSLSLLQTNRQIYREAVNVLYTTNTFDISEPLTLLFFTPTILPQRLQSIRYLQVQWKEIPPYLSWRGHTWAYRWEDSWENMWETIRREMTGLRSLKLCLNIQTLTPHVYLEDPETYQDPMMHLQNPRSHSYDEQYFDSVLRIPREKVRGLHTFELESFNWGKAFNCDAAEEKTRQLHNTHGSPSDPSFSTSISSTLAAHSFSSSQLPRNHPPITTTMAQPAAAIPEQPAPSIRVTNLSYTFPDRTTGLHNVTLSLPSRSRHPPHRRERRRKNDSPPPALRQASRALKHHLDLRT